MVQNNCIVVLSGVQLLLNPCESGTLNQNTALPLLVFLVTTRPKRHANLLYSLGSNTATDKQVRAMEKEYSHFEIKFLDHGDINLC